MQTKQQYKNTQVYRFINENGTVIGYQGRYPSNSSDGDWVTVDNAYDPVTEINKLASDKQKAKLASNPKNLTAAHNLYEKLIQRGYSPKEASDSTGYVPQGG